MKKHTNLPIPGDFAYSRAFNRARLLDPVSLPISFIYDGKTYTGLSANARVSRELVDSNLERTVMTDQLPGGVEVRAECLHYRDYPVVEWTVWFENQSDRTSPMLQDLNAVSCSFTAAQAEIEHNNGDFFSEDGYTVSNTRLAQGEKLRMAPTGGRPCDRAFPYQRVLHQDGGILISIGWPGQWYCEYIGKSDGLYFTAGQETVQTVLEPGEIFRSPRMTLMFYTGTRARGINLWRRWFNAHVTPKAKGEITQPVFVTSDNAGGIEFTLTTEENQIDSIRYIKELDIGANLWWIDAGWYPCKNAEGKPDWTLTGSWFADPERYPRGLKPVSDACHDAGMDLLVWFEPERVRPGFALAKEHPEWMLSKKEYGEKEVRDMMLNLGDADCCRWLSEYIAGYLADNGIDWYRQDFNFQPLKFWRDNEEKNRKGMCENQYVQGYLRFWDYLLLNVSDLRIDSCASGGRRNDMETMRRSVPLHPTDYGYGYHHINQAFRHSLYSWIPYVRGWTGSWDIDGEYYSHEDYYAPDIPQVDNFKQTNGFAVTYGVSSVDTLRACEDTIPYARKMAHIAERFAPIALRSDFYPLTPNHRDFTQWTVFQFDCPETASGAFQVLRNNKAAQESLTVFPQGFENVGEYLLENPETGESMTVDSAAILKDGITFTLPLRAGSVWFYTKK